MPTVFCIQSKEDNHSIGINEALELIAKNRSKSTLLSSSPCNMFFQPKAILLALPSVYLFDEVTSQHAYDCMADYLKLLKLDTCFSFNMATHPTVIPQAVIDALSFAPEPSLTIVLTFNNTGLDLYQSKESTEREVLKIANIVKSTINRTVTTYCDFKKNEYQLEFFNFQLSVQEQLKFMGQVVWSALQATNLADTYKIVGFDLDKFLSLQAERLNIAPANNAKAAPLTKEDEELYELTDTNTPGVKTTQPILAQTKQEVLDVATKQFFSKVSGITTSWKKIPSFGETISVLPLPFPVFQQVAPALVQVLTQRGFFAKPVMDQSNGQCAVTVDFAKTELKL